MFCVKLAGHSNGQFHSRQEEAREVDELCFPITKIKRALIWGGSHPITKIKRALIWGGSHERH